AVLGYDSAAAVIAVVERKIDRENLDLENVARLRPCDVRRPGEDMTSRTFSLAGDLVDNRLERFLDSVRRDAGPPQALGRIGQHRIDIDDVARGNAQRRLCLRPVVAISHRRGRRLEAVGGGSGAALRGERARAGERKGDQDGKLLHDGVTLSRT